MKAVTSEQMRKLDRKAIRDLGITGDVLMERAGGGVADVVSHLAHLSGYASPLIHLFAGRGNNGGDAFVAARCLREMGMECEVWLAAEAKAVSGDALTHLGRMRAAEVPLHELPTQADWADALASWDGGEILVDGLLGTGISGPARGPVASAIGCINELSSTRLVVAIDVPSGLNADTGEAEGGAVMADITATMGLPKRGLIEQNAIDYVGSVEVIDIGLPPGLHGDLESDRELIAEVDLAGLIRRRPRHAHKGMFGHVLVVGGAPGYAGAVAMAARAALRSGVGLATVLVPAGIAQVVAGLVPEAMVHPAAATETGSLSSEGLATWSRRMKDFDAVLIGPGMTTHEQTGLIVRRALETLGVPLVLDADALNVCAGHLDAVQASAGPVVLTPHPGEMARLLACTPADVQGDRARAGVLAAEKTGRVVVLKGAGTLVVQKGRPVHVNMTGNPGMATGGMGDVLGGLLASLLAQGLSPFDAARAAVYIHGRAGDNAAWMTSQAGMTAVDVIEELPHVFRDLNGR